MVEYGLIIALIAVACIVGFKALGGKINDKTNAVGDELDKAGNTKASTTPAG